ncbi:peptidase inhibitor family I36 protein [Streptomonospora algeriensis]|uniref:Peptidase inhibitor family I36 protein n=1 Tax=Streptomonospora algeriensis TaxID=995084 RepID=A0ABW3BLG5_9ACTN
MRATVRAAAVAAATAALAAAPLSAAADDSASAAPDCEPGNICGYTGYDYTGEMIPLPAGAGCVNPKAPIRSIANTYSSPGIPAVAQLYTGLNCRALTTGSVGPGESIPTLDPEAQSVFLAW